MAHYMMLGRLTTKGLDTIEDSEERIKKFRSICEQEGARVTSFYLLLGNYDIACTIEAPTPDVIAKLALIVGKRGNVRTETLPIFTDAEFINMVKKLK